MRICTKCGNEKLESDFFIRDSKSRRLHSQCKVCHQTHRKLYYKQHYEKYKAEYLKRAKTRRSALRQEFRTRMLAYLSDKSCVLCGESDIRTLDFDHLNPDTKKFNISQAARLGHDWQKVQDEISKCRILCANCHRKHTSTQAKWYKAI